MEIEDVREIDGERYLAPKVAAAQFGLTRDQIGQWARLGSINAKLVGRVWYIREQDLIERRAREDAERRAEEERIRLEEERLRQEEEALRSAEEEPEPVEVEPEPMTFAKRLAQRKATPAIVPDVTMQDEEVSHETSNERDESTGEELQGEPEYTDEESNAEDRSLRPSAPVASSSVRTIGIRNANPEILRRDKERGQRHAQILGSMDVRYERGEPIEYDYEPVPGVGRRPHEDTAQPTQRHPVRMAGNGKSELRTKRASSPHERPIRRDMPFVPPALDAIKRTPSPRATVRVTESNRPTRAPDADLQRPRKKKKSKRVVKKRKALKMVLLWTFIVLLALGALYLAVVFFEGA